MASALATLTGMSPADEMAPNGEPSPELESVTRLLEEAQHGCADAWDRIYSLLYQDLHRIARSQIRQSAKGIQAFTPTSLISETWLRLANADAPASSRAHLTCLIARAMRFVLVDEVRRLLTEKRGDGINFVELNDSLDPSFHAPPEQILVLNQALESLALMDERLAKVVELRYFGGLNEREIAEVFDVTERTVRRDWRKARAYLASHLETT